MEPGSGLGTPLGSLETSICATDQDLNKKPPRDKHSSQTETMKLKPDPSRHYSDTECFLVFDDFLKYYTVLS